MRPAPPDRRTLGAPDRHLVLGGGRTVVLHLPGAVVAVCALVLALAASLVALATGPYPLSPSALVEVLGGGGDATARFIVVDQRLARAVAAIVVGGALGASGAVFQSLSRNPLGSPDVVGFTRGAATGGLVAIIVLGGVGPVVTVAGAVTGGAATAAVVVALSVRRGAGGERLVLAGIAVGQMLAAVNDYLLTVAEVESAEAARAWQYGSLNGVTWQSVGPVLVVLTVLLPVGLVLCAPARVLEMGDDAAAGLGVRPRALRVGMIAYGVLLSAVSVAVAGPIGFLALAAPQVARRLSGATGLQLLPSACVGAALLAAADLAAGRALSPFQIPVGLVSSALGGLYLAWLVGSAGRSGRAWGALR